MHLEINLTHIALEKFLIQDMNIKLNKLQQLSYFLRGLGIIFQNFLLVENSYSIKYFKP